MGENHSNKNNSTNSLYQKELVQSFISEAKGLLDAGQGEAEPVLTEANSSTPPLVVLPKDSNVDSEELSSNPNSQVDYFTGLEEDENSYKKKLATAAAAAAAIGGGAYALSKVRAAKAKNFGKKDSSSNDSQSNTSDDLKSAYGQMKRLQKLLRLTHLSDGEMIEALSIMMSIQLEKVVEFGEIESYVEGVKSASARRPSRDFSSLFTF